MTSAAHGVPGAGLEPARGLPQGIFIPLQLSLLHASHASHASHAFVVWTLPLPSRKHSFCAHGLGRGHQVSTLSLAGHETTTGTRRVDPGLARYCRHLDVLLFHRL